MPDDDPRDKRRTPSSGLPVTSRLPSVPRTPTPSNDQLAAEVKRLTALLQRPDLERRIERVEAVANKDLLPYIKETGAKYERVTVELTRLSTKFEAMTGAVGGWRSDIADRLGDHSDRIAAVEDRSARNQVRLDTQDDERLPERVRALEQQQASTNTELALTRKQKTGVAALGTATGTAAGGIAWLLSQLLGG